jgi:hypothetical protein
MESREDCLREAAECDRLAQLANTQGTRTLLRAGSRRSLRDVLGHVACIV